MGKVVSPSSSGVYVSFVSRKRVLLACLQMSPEGLAAFPCTRKARARARAKGKLCAGTTSEVPAAMERAAASYTGDCRVVKDTKWVRQDSWGMRGLATDIHSAALIACQESKRVAACRHVRLKALPAGFVAGDLQLDSGRKPTTPTFR